jgi:hypothetical protein
MTAMRCENPLVLADVIDYAIGELSGGRQDAFEAHLFECEPCSRLLDSTVRLGTAIAGAFGGGHIAVAATADLVNQANQQGARIREYRVTPGEAAACTIAPDESAVAIRLAGIPPGVNTVDIDVAFDDLDSGHAAARRFDDVPVDGAAREVVLLTPGAMVRAYPRSRWTMTAHAEGTADLGHYTLDHTPWDRLPHGY